MKNSKPTAIPPGTHEPPQPLGPNPPPCSTPQPWPAGNVGMPKPPR